MFTEDQESLRSVVRKFLADKSPESEVRRLMETESGFDPAVWTQLAEELGVCGLAVPEAYGGAGHTFIEVGVVMEELGRSLACLPYYSTVVLAQSLLVNADDEDAAKRWLPGLSVGTIRGAVAFTEPSGRWDEDGVGVIAGKDGSAWRISGTKTFVIDGHTADVVFVAARTDAGVSLFSVEGDASGLTRSALPTLDQTRKQAQLDFVDVRAQLVGIEGSGWAVLSRVLDIAAAGLSAESVGGAQLVLDMAVDHAKTRVQFGRPIGSFQAIKHKCADILLELESAKAAAHQALWEAAHGGDKLPIIASLAKAYCQDAFFEAAAANIQVHGGIGFTWEHPAHLYFKRAKSSQLLLGGSSYHRELLVQRIGL